MKDALIFMLFTFLIFGALFFGVRKLIFSGMESAPEYQTQEQDSVLTEQQQLMKQRQRDQRDAMRRQKQKIRDLRRR